MADNENHSPKKDVPQNTQNTQAKQNTQNTQTIKKSGFDSAWKSVIERFFPKFMEFYFPDIYKQIDWEQEYIFRDNELQSIELGTGFQPAHSNKSGLRRADKLVSLKALNGTITNVMLHIEVQDSDKYGFAERMFMYHYRLYDRYKKKFDDNEYEKETAGEALCDTVVSIALLSDLSEKNRTSSYEYDNWGCSLKFDFPIVKLIDYEDEIKDLKNIKNPFAIATAAHLAQKRSRETQKKLKTEQQRISFFEELSEQKFSIVKALFEAGLKREEIVKFLEFVDWIIKLPPVYELKFEENVKSLEKEKKMGFTQRLFDEGKIEGKIEGKNEGIIEGESRGETRGETKGEARGFLKLAEAGDLDLEKAKSRIDSLRSSLNDEKFWAEVDDRLKKLHN